MFCNSLDVGSKPDHIGKANCMHNEYPKGKPRERFSATNIDTKKAIEVAITET